MSNGYYLYTLELKDKMSSGLKKASVSSEKLRAKLTTLAQNTQKNFDKLPHSIDKLRERLNKLQQDRNTAFSRTEVRRFNGEIRKTERQLRKLENLPPLSVHERFRKMGEQMTSLIGIGGTLGGTLAALAAGRSILSLGAKREQDRTEFRTLMQSDTAGDAMFNSLDEFANRTPFQNQHVHEGAKTLLNFGVAGNEILPMMQRLGDVSGGNAERMKSLSLAFGQMHSAGRLMGQDLLQMINAGFNPLQEISKQTGESMASLKQKMSDGRISVEDVTLAFASATSEGGRFHNMMEKQSQTLSGRWSTLVGKTKLALAQLGETLAPLFKALTKVAIALVDNGKALLVIGASIAPLIINWNALRTAMVANVAVQKILAIATGNLTIKQLALNSAMNANPILLIISAIGMGIGAYMLFSKKTDGATKSLRTQIDTYKVLGKIKRKAIQDIAKERSEIDLLFDKIRSGNATQSQRTEAYDKLKEMYPQLLSGYKSEVELLKNVDEAQSKIIEKITKRAEAEAARNMLTEVYEKLFEKEQKAKELNRELKSANEELNHSSKWIASGGVMNPGYQKMNPVYQNLIEQQKILNKNINENSAGMEKLRKQADFVKSKINVDAEVTETVTTNTHNEIITGGRRSKIFNITIGEVKGVDTMNVHEGTAQDGEDVAKTTLEALVRTLGSATKIALE